MAGYTFSDLDTSTLPSLIELFELDLNPAGVAEVVRITDSYNEAASDGRIEWGSRSWYPFPIRLESVEASTQGTSPRPQLSLSNLEQPPGTALTSTFGQLAFANEDLVSAVVKRYQVFVNDINVVGEPNQPASSSSASFGLDEFVVAQKSQQDKQRVVLDLAAEFDLPTAKLPGRQILRSDFPGVDRFRR